VTHIRAQVARIWRRRYLVAAIAALAALAAAATVDDRTSYTATATLITVSTDRSPEQDGILARGYVNLFIEPSFQQTLREQGGIPAGVAFTARTAAASPIIYISATSTDKATAKLAATQVAEAFRSKVNSSLRANREQKILAMQKAFDELYWSTNAPVRVPAQINLQDRIEALHADPTNELQTLEADSGAIATPPQVVRTVGVALVGGLIFGCLIAWSLGFISRRLSVPFDSRKPGSSLSW
jgi:hypothetical protein